MNWRRWYRVINAAMALAMTVALLFAFAILVSASPDIILEPSFETVVNWTYSETDPEFIDGAQSTTWKTQGTYSYKFSSVDNITVDTYSQIAQSVDFTNLDTLSFDANLWMELDNHCAAKVLVGTTEVWSQVCPTTATDYLHQKVNVSGYTGTLDLIFRVTGLKSPNTSKDMIAYFDNIKTWGSFNDAAHTIVDNNFGTGENTVYMEGENFDSGTIKVGYYDALGDWVETDDYIGFGGGTLTSECILNQDWGGSPPAGNGTWHAVVIQQADSLPPTYAEAIVDTEYIIDDDFYVAESAIPEFPTVIAAIGVAGLCFAIYYWMRKRRLAYVQA